MSEIVPDWLRALRNVRALEDEGVRWFTDQEADEATKANQEIDDSRQKLSDDALEEANAALESMMMVGTRRAAHQPEYMNVAVNLWLDKARPDQLLVGLNQQIPLLWFAAGTSADHIREAIAPYLPADFRTRPSQQQRLSASKKYAAGQEKLPPNPAHNRRCRLLIGLQCNKSDVDLVAVENYLVLNPFCEGGILLLGSAFMSVQSDPEITVAETLYSRSRVTLLWYKNWQSGAMFADIEYPACAQHEAIAAYNSRFDTNFPLDVPTDVPAMLLSLNGLDAANIQQQMLEKTDVAELVVTIPVLVELVAPDFELWFAPFLSHPDVRVRGTIALHAHLHGRDDFVQRMAEVEPHAGMRELMADRFVSVVAQMEAAEAEADANDETRIPRPWVFE